jgi:murein DD-endopeptidase MepM/ murein hydrolase activator NlpD
LFPKKGKASYFTFLLIPHTTHTPRSLRFPTWALYMAGVLGGIFLMATALLVVYVVTIQQDYRQIAALKTLNQQQAVEIKELNQQFLELQERVAGIDAQEEAIRRLMGLKLEAMVEPSAGTLADEAVVDISLGQGGPVNPVKSISVSRSRGSVGIFSTREIQRELGNLAKEIKFREENLEKLKQAVEADPAYYRALPNYPPAQGRLTSPYGERPSPFGGKRREMHAGIDLANAHGTPVVAAGEGVVSFAGVKSGYGRLIVINHGHGFITSYAHNSKLLVNEGDKVGKGQKIALMGNTGRSTGPHVHFTLQKKGEKIDPLYLLDFDRLGR